MPYKDPEKRREYDKQRLAADPQKPKRYSLSSPKERRDKIWRDNVKRKYGWEVLQVLMTLHDQEWCCTLSKEPFDPDEHSHIDHDHTTGEVRGIIRAKYNKLLVPAVEKYPHLIQATKEYLGIA